MQVIVSSAFKRAAKKLSQQETLLLFEVLNFIKAGEKLPFKYHEHSLIGNYVGYTECHIRPDLLMIFKITDDCIYLYKIGTHSELFD